jgi:hypothetical protein
MAGRLDFCRQAVAQSFSSKSARKRLGKQTLNGSPQRGEGISLSSTRGRGEGVPKLKPQTLLFVVMLTGEESTWLPRPFLSGAEPCAKTFCLPARTELPTLTARVAPHVSRLWKSTGDLDAQIICSFVWDWHSRYA